MRASTRFHRTVGFVVNVGGVRVVWGRGTNPAPHARGQAILRRRVRCTIRLWPPARGPRTRGYDQLTACLIHEYGHIVLRWIPHTEREAWSWGRRAVPTQCIPPGFRHFARRCLDTYGPRLSRERSNGCTGRGYVWAPKRRG